VNGSAVNPTSRSLRDLGLAAWFGGTLYGVAASNRGVQAVRDPQERLPVADSIWDRWVPIGAAAVATHLVASAITGWGNKSRTLGQEQMGGQMAIKGALSAFAAVATGAAFVQRKQLLRAWEETRAEVQDATTPLPNTPEPIAQMQRRLRIAETTVPALVGAVVLMNGRMSEQQRPVPTIQRVANRLALGD
jgi:hypothetical protein